MLTLPVYLDYNATTPVDPLVVEAMLPFFTRYFGNAASKTHSFGWEADAAVELAREQVAQLINASPEEIVFTSGATEADNLALKGIFEMYRSKGNHIITVKTEHKAVLDTCDYLKRSGAEITFLNVNAYGEIDLHALKEAIRPDTILISVMYANNETGVLQPVKEIAEIANSNNILFFSDATQAIGKVSVDVTANGIHCMAFSAHKMYGPKGVGALFVKRKNPRARLQSQMQGGGHQRGMRSGTLNVPGIVGFGKACELCLHTMKEENARIQVLRDRLESSLLSDDMVKINGDPIRRLPNTSNLFFPNHSSADLISILNSKLAISAGSACTSGNAAPSFVLAAMGLGEERSKSSLRFSLGRFTTEEEINFAIRELREAISVKSKV